MVRTIEINGQKKYALTEKDYNSIEKVIFNGKTLYVIKPHRKHVPKEQMEEYLRNNKNIHEIAEDLEFSEQYVRTLLNRYFGTSSISNIKL